jgi:Methyltransferase domain
MSKFATSALRFFTENMIAARQKIEWPAFRKRYGLPRSMTRGQWSMDSRDFEAIFDTVRSCQAHGRMTIVELGSGFSTLVLASVLPRVFKESDITTIEGEENYAHQVQEMLRLYDLDRFVKVRWVPYATNALGIWFSKPELQQVMGDKKVDILIVDAPPGHWSRCARQPAIPFFLPYLKPNAKVMLHDALRPDESLITKDWRQYFRVCYRIKTFRGFAIFEGRIE